MLALNSNKTKINLIIIIILSVLTAAMLTATKAKTRIARMLNSFAGKMQKEYSLLFFVWHLLNYF